MRAILILRSLLAAGFLVLGLVLLFRGSPVFGALALAFGATNAFLVVVINRRAA